METSASFEARSAPSSYPTTSQAGYYAALPSPAGDSGSRNRVILSTERDGAFLVLPVQSKSLLRAERELVSHFQVKRLSLEQMLERVPKFLRSATIFGFVSLVSEVDRLGSNVRPLRSD
jgi:hypothetical protein